MAGKDYLLPAVILGPTASGKTVLAVALVERLRLLGIAAEIISADSRQLYRGMDIGTAKPNAEQRRQAPHHLLDVAAPDETLGLAEYLRLAKACVADCQQRGALPILVGGTGQYLSAYLDDWQIPRVPPQQDFRARLLAEAEENGGQALYQRLCRLDPPAAAKIHPHNLRRIVRALEVIEITDRPFSEQQKRGKSVATQFRIGLHMARERLYERAARRLEQMMADGFLEEVRELLARGHSPGLPSFSAFGYRQLAAHLAGECSLDDALEGTAQATRHYIRRQLSWFRHHDDGVVWLEWSDDALEQTVERLTGQILARRAVGAKEAPRTG